ncbi:MAG: LuxR C-terminal-related transcriptional regulator [Polaribacter sp.]|jgi:DNA-binding NarL/FixJ family response regulator|nr:LuxR C-terminal-related transcriptional regulator [Polaribacter sp.]MDG1955362.1 LuxR C-terminal-related transcriptional regulator [Polaribacter sp.]MDG2074502.1 LuxR C-terminal-related transcriptional regulator [Polaribacter sp.]
MNLLKQITKKGVLLALAIAVGICAFVFTFLYAPEYARSVQVNSINSMMIITFLLLVLIFGIILGRTKESIEVITKFETNLTDREKEIVLLIIQRKKNIEIANTLFVELSTIKSHINNIYKKENVKNRKEII